MDIQQVRLHCFTVMVGNDNPSESVTAARKIWRYLNNTDSLALQADETTIPFSSLEVFGDVDKAEFLRVLQLVHLGNFPQENFGNFNLHSHEVVYEEMQRAYFLSPQVMSAIKAAYYANHSLGLYAVRTGVREAIEALHKEDASYLRDVLNDLDNNATWPS